MAAEGIAIVGPTACGKTRRAVEVAQAFGGEIISGDSRQVYRMMDIGTGKDLAEYSDIPYHLIDICEPGSKYNLHQFLRDFNKAYNEIINHHSLPVICGGTGMYIENALKGIQLPEVPENTGLRQELANYTLDELASILKDYKTLHNVTDIDTKARAIRAIEIQEYYVTHPEEAKQTATSNARPLNCIVIGIDIPREDRRRRISDRLRSRLDEGMVEEIRGLIQSGVKAEDLIYYGLEYKFVTQYVIGEISFHDMVRNLEIAIHQFAKRQMTWFRGMERRGIPINWIPYNIPKEEFISRVEILLR